MNNTNQFNNNYIDQFEPNGLYYSIKFKRFLEDRFYLAKYMHGIIFNNKKIYTSITNKNKDLILQINTFNDVKKYVKYYSKNLKEYNEYWKDKINKFTNYKNNNKNKYIIIDYNKLSNDFAGIEFRIDANDTYLIGYYAVKYYGCIWNINIIKELKLMLKFN